MAISGVERIVDDWATAWSSREPDKVLSLFTDDCVYEDVTFGVINHGKKELRAFAEGVFAGIPDFKVELTARFVAGTWGGMEWVRDTQGRLPRDAGHGKAVLSAGCDDPRTPGRKDPAQLRLLGCRRSNEAGRPAPFTVADLSGRHGLTSRCQAGDACPGKETP